VGFNKGGFRSGGRYDETDVVPSQMQRLEALAQQSILKHNSEGIPQNQPLVDNTRLGSFWVRAGVSIPAAGISLPHQLGRKPSGFIIVNDQAAGYPYQNGTDLAASTPTVLVVRARWNDTVATILVE